jgi:predicted chitinase
MRGVASFLANTGLETRVPKQLEESPRHSTDRMANAWSGRFAGNTNVLLKCR